MTAPETTAVEGPGRGTADPYGATATGGGFLPGLSPLAKLAGPLPAMIALVFVRDLTTPLVFLGLSYLVLLIGLRLTPRNALLLFVAVPAATAVVSLGFALWTDTSRVDQSVAIVRLGDAVLYGDALETGLATGLRFAAIIGLSLIAGLSSTGVDIVRALVQQLRVPYRIGYTALAAFRFVPRFGYELEVIRQAHRVRGAGGGRLGALLRWPGYIVPLLAGAIRHAERVALAMDARAFGAYPDRTERHLMPFRARDAVFLITSAVVTIVVLWAFFPWQPR